MGLDALVGKQGPLGESLRGVSVDPANLGSGSRDDILSAQRQLGARAFGGVEPSRDSGPTPESPRAAERLAGELLERLETFPEHLRSSATHSLEMLLTRSDISPRIKAETLSEILNLADATTVAPQLEGVGKLSSAADVRAELVASLLLETGEPYRVNQGRAMSCYATVPGAQLCLVRPDVYAEHLRELVVDGVTTLPGGTQVKLFVEEHLRGAGLEEAEYNGGKECRTLTMALWQRSYGGDKAALSHTTEHRQGVIKAEIDTFNTPDLDTLTGIKKDLESDCVGIVQESPRAFVSVSTARRNGPSGDAPPERLTDAEIAARKAALVDCIIEAASHGYTVHCGVLDEGTAHTTMVVAVRERNGELCLDYYDPYPGGANRLENPSKEQPWKQLSPAELAAILDVAYLPYREAPQSFETLRRLYNGDAGYQGMIITADAILNPVSAAMRT